MNRRARHRPLAALLLALSLPLAAEEKSDFSTPPPDTWQRFDPLTQIGQNLGSFDFSGANCRLVCGVPPLEVIQIYQAGAAPRLVLYAPTTFTRSVSSVNLVSWTPTTNRSLNGSFLSVFTRCQQPAGFGTVNAYSAAVEVLPSNRAILRLYLIFNESPLLLASSPEFDFVPGTPYRLLLQSEGAVHIGSLHDLNNPTSPLARIQAVQDLFAEGRCGFGLVTDRPTPIDATFDDFLAWNGDLPALVPELVATPPSLRLKSPLFRSLTSRIETSAALDDPDQPWLPLASPETAHEGEDLVITVPLSGPARFFRRSTE
jgi:hypothetical protein